MNFLLVNIKNGRVLTQDTGNKDVKKVNLFAGVFENIVWLNGLLVSCMIGIKILNFKVNEMNK